ncbi:malto-oligosyltrehalose trehalohydrolase [Paraburkholderia dinghuensis]|uniref:Malto-oligosyltrehalose trehalohydrolase n=1 Tax=Paraburkholderia dinghuensis TaxID=2305225 RepID=A0A3N6Q0I4_9BURK|nr:malto-oligosyltrehalose trehalohydrolase [Paraburkholderia dinghuensis]RQH05676.1 malto-oligosyltrehalose trehalohydrolase [Paraburkholderia dinghuensis]
MSSPMHDPHARRYMHCLPFGAQLSGAARGKPQTRFRFWAPSCQAVQVVFETASDAGDGGAPFAPLDMTPTGNGWFEAQAPCGPGTLYRYRIDGGQEVPDPASRFQPQGVHGPSAVLDPRAYAWQHAHWMGRPWEETVIYELHVGALGGYGGVSARLPALAELGVTAIELMPLNDYPGERGWGYDGVLLYAPHAAYGTPDELKGLIDTAHGLGLQVFIDVVYNHFGPDGNWLGEYAKPFFRHDVKTPWGVAPDFDRFEVRDFFCDNALYWLTEYRFDGLRIDAAHAIGNAPWLRELSDHVHARIETGRHVHLVLENDRNAANLLETHFDAQWNDDAHHALHVLLTGENEGYYRSYAAHPIRKLARVLAEGFAYQGEASPAHAGQPRGEPSAHLPTSAFVVFLQNHDQIGNRAFGERLRKLCDDDDALRAATALQLLTPQIPLLFMDEEYGSTQPFQYFTAYTGDLADAVREGRRREFAAFSAFSDPARRERIPDPNDVRTFANSSPPLDTRQDGDRLEWMHFYKSALAVRARLLTPRLRRANALGATVLADDTGNDLAALVARWRLDDGAILTLALNLGREGVPLNHEPDGMVVFETPARARDRIDNGVLPARSCVAWLTGDVPDYAIHHDARVVHRVEPQA